MKSFLLPSSDVQSLGAGISKVERRLPALDGWRGVAILLVLLYHFVDCRTSSWWEKIAFRFVTAGWTGVDLFFVLSGFLITGILCDTRTAPLYYRSFYLRRFLRIEPLYLIWMTLLIALLGKHTVFTEFIQSAQVFSIYGMVVNWSLLWFPHQEVTGMAWSLSVEEHFYVFWPLLVKRFGNQGLVPILIFVIVASLATRTVGVLVGAPQAFLDFNTFSRCDSLAIGSLLALAKRTPRVWRKWSTVARQFALVVTGCLIVLATFQGFQLNSGYPSMRILGYTLIAAFWACILTFALQPDENKNWAQQIGKWRGLQMLGKYSYALYLINPAILVLLKTHVWLRLPFSTLPVCRLLLMPLTGIGITFALAYLSWITIERRALSLKKFFTPCGGTGSRDGGFLNFSPHGVG